MNFFDLMTHIAEGLGYLFALIFSIYGFIKWLRPHVKTWQHKRRVVSVENIEHIKDIAYRAWGKAHFLIDLLESAVYVCKPSGECVYSSKTLCQMFGRDEKLMMNYGWTEAIAEELRAEEYEKWVDCVRENKPYSSTYPIFVDGERKVVHTAATAYRAIDPITKKEGEILFYIGYVKEI